MRRYLHSTWCRRLVRAILAAVFVLAALQLDRFRDDPIVLFAQRLAACGTTASVVAGCIALQLLPDGESIVSANRHERPRREAAVGAARV
eukprot:UN4841